MLEMRDFVSHYDFAIVDDLGRANVAALPRLFFPGATSVGGRDGVSVRFHPSSADSWVGTFAFESRVGLDCAATCPDPEMLLVVSGGAAYETYPHNRSHWRLLPVYLVGQVVPVLRYQLMLLAYGSGILALNASGVAWRNHEISAGSTTIESISGTIATGIAEDPSSETHTRTFTIDILTGDHQGGKTTGRRLIIEPNTRD